MAEDVRTFVEWVKSRGASFPNVELRVCEDGSGYGLYSKGFIRFNETFITLPRDLMITAGTIADIPKYREILKKIRLLPFETLVLFFLLEDQNSSPFGPYLKMLPLTFTTPLMKLASLDPLELPESERALWVNQQNEVNNMYDKVSKALLPKVISFERFLWAWHVVNTRCIFVENREHPLIDNSHGDTLAVIPFVDMLNHSPNNQGFAMWDSVLKSYRVHATRAINAGEQIYVCYGGHTNGRLWIDYGFILPNNPYNKVGVSREKLITLAESVGITVTDAHRRTLEIAHLPCTLYSSDGAPSFGFKANMRILQLDPSKLRSYYEAMFDDSTESSDVLIIKALMNLREEFCRKLSSVSPSLKWLWKEQIEVLDECLQGV